MLFLLLCTTTAGQVVAREGGIGNKMFIVNVGIATLKKKRVVIKTYPSGNHFCFRPPWCCGGSLFGMCEMQPLNDVGGMGGILFIRS